MVEGVFRGSRSAIRPIELGRRVVREMDDQRSVDVKGRRVVPNDFVIHLSPRDLAGFDDLCRPEAVFQQNKDGKKYLVVTSEESGAPCVNAPFTYIRAEIKTSHGHSCGCDD